MADDFDRAMEFTARALLVGLLAPLVLPVLIFLWIRRAALFALLGGRK